MPTDHIWVCVLSHLSFCGMIFDLFSIHFILNNFFKNIFLLCQFWGRFMGAQGLFHSFFILSICSPVFQVLRVRVREYTTFCSALRLYLSPALHSHLRNISSKVSLILGLHLLHLLNAFSISYNNCVIQAQELSKFISLLSQTLMLFFWTAPPGQISCVLLTLFPVWIRAKEQGSEEGVCWQCFHSPGKRLCGA